jgi:hypothetical protein
MAMPSKNGLMPNEVNMYPTDSANSANLGMDLVQNPSPSLPVLEVSLLQ